MGLVSDFSRIMLVITFTIFCHSSWKRFDGEPTSRRYPMVFFFLRCWSDEFRALRRNTWPISKPFVRLPWDLRHTHCLSVRMSVCCVCICVSACLSLTKLSMKNNCGGYVLKNRTQNSQVVPKIFCHWFYSHILNQSWFVCYFFFWEISLCSSTWPKFSVPLFLSQMVVELRLEWWLSR